MKRVLVLGAYGLIGASVSRHLEHHGYSVVGMGRNRRAMQAAHVPKTWLAHDISTLTSANDWQPILQDIDAVVNCAGALQDGPKDDLETLHVTAIAALGAAAAPSGIQVIQISAAGVGADASTAFFRSKFRGDTALLECGAPVVIFRPGLVISQQSYGGTALIRQLAAVPFVQPIAMANAQVQTVWVADVARAVQRALAGQFPNKAVFDLVETHPQSLLEVVQGHRHWLGFATPRFTVDMPRFALALTSKVADAFGRLGWRSPLRSSAVRVLKDGVRGDPSAYSEAVGPLHSFGETLAQIPVGSEHRLQARMSLMAPIGVAVLSVFWFLSGLIGIVSLGDAAASLEAAGWAPWFSRLSVLGWSFVDIALAGLVLHRAWTSFALKAMLGVCFIYLSFGTVLTPWMWLDPLGPLVKILPAILAISLLRPLLESR